MFQDHPHPASMSGKKMASKQLKYSQMKGIQGSNRKRTCFISLFHKSPTSSQVLPLRMLLTPVGPRCWPAAILFRETEFHPPVVDFQCHAVVGSGEMAIWPTLATYAIHRGRAFVLASSPRCSMTQPHSMDSPFLCFGWGWFFIFANIDGAQNYSQLWAPRPKTPCSGHLAPFSWLVYVIVHCTDSG